MYSRGAWPGWALYFKSIVRPVLMQLWAAPQEALGLLVQAWQERTNKHTLMYL